ncbi:MAG: glycosyl hydrolase, partial [Burkholderiales bacterium PBB5]
ADADSTRTDGFDEAVAIARQADVVIVSVGEGPKMAGEARSRSRIGLPGVQEQLLKALHATGKPMVVMVNAGRPPVLEWAAEHVPAILCTWWLGSEAGNAIADVLLGAHNPSARLPISFPRNEGQIPVHYSHLNTGRPADSDTGTGFVSHYLDVPTSPRWAFGHGLSYTQFDHASLTLDQPRLAGPRGQVTVSIDVTNTGAVAGDEVVQLYLRQRVASVVQPVKVLKDFRRVHLAPGERQTVRFAIDRGMLSFVNARLQRVTEPGEIDVMVGASSADIRQRTSFTLLD